MTHARRRLGRAAVLLVAVLALAAAPALAAEEPQEGSGIPTPPPAQPVAAEEAPPASEAPAPAPSPMASPATSPAPAAKEPKPAAEETKEETKAEEPKQAEGPAAEQPAEADPVADAPNPVADGLLDAGMPFAPNPYFGFGGEAATPAPAFAGSGTDALLRGPSLQAGNAPTLFERYGSQGLSLDSPSNLGGDGNQPLNAIAAGLFGIAAWLAQAVIAIFQWAFTLELFDFVGAAVAAMVGELRDLLYRPFIQAAVIAAGLALVWHGMVRRRTTVAFEGMAWVIVALTVGALFLAKPTGLIDAANHVSTGLARTVLAGVSVVDPQTGPADGTTTVATFEGAAADTQLRVAADRFWRVFVYQPWLVLQFGDHEAGARYGERLLAARTLTAAELQELDRRGGREEALAELVAAKQEDHAALTEEIGRDERLAPWFRGQRAVERMGVASLALTGVLLGGVLLVAVSAAILLAQIAFLLLVVLAPLVLLLGVHPRAGRLITVRWAELLVGLLIKRVALGILLAVVLVLGGVLLDATYPLGWLVTMGLQALIVGTVVAYRKPFARILAPTTVPVEVARSVGAPLRAQAARMQQSWRTPRRVGGAAGAAAAPAAGNGQPAKPATPRPDRQAPAVVPRIPVTTAGATAARRRLRAGTAGHHAPNAPNAPSGENGASNGNGLRGGGAAP
jgi:hypothetical protein